MNGALEAVSGHEFWRGRRVLITGHTGFKGAWLAWILMRMGAIVSGIGLSPSTRPSLFELLNLQDKMHHHAQANICDVAATGKLVNQSNPEVVFHLAAQALVRESYIQPVNTFATNVLGTTNVLEALRGLPECRVAVMVTTDKVYHNHEWFWSYREDDRLGGYDPYSASKAASEIVIESYRKCFLQSQGVAVASARAGNVIGGGDWSIDRLIPDAVRAWVSDEVLDIRSPDAVRPWQHVLEPLTGYLTLAKALWGNPQLAGAYNFGPSSHESASVRYVIGMAQEFFGSGQVSFSQKQLVLHEAGLLSLDTSKVRSVLNVKPRWGLSQSIAMTMDWYRDFHAGHDAQSLCERDVQRFGPLA